MRIVADRQAFAVVVSIALSLTAGLVFFIAAWAGGYSWVGGLGGGGWVAFLTLIIALPTLMPWMRERLRRDQPPAATAPPRQVET